MPKVTSTAPADRQQVLTLEEVADRLEQVLQSTCADEVELVWLDTRRLEVASGGSTAGSPLDRAIMIRVLDRGRLGTHRTCAAAVPELEQAVRQAVAQSRARMPLPGLPHLPGQVPPTPPVAGAWDPEVADLGRSQARALLQRLERDGEQARLRWGAAWVTIFNSRGLRQQAQVTHVDLEVSCERRDGSGRAAAASRNLASLDAESIFDRARRRHGPAELAPTPPSDAPVILAPECVAELCEVLKRDAFSASSYQQGYSFLRDHLGDQVFDRNLNLRDDGTDPAGLPFPFDLEGTAKQRVDLISGGTARTPALDQRQAAVLGLPPTGHSITGNDAQGENLFLLPGTTGESELLRAAEGGIWIGSFDRLECFEPRRLMFRARARGVRGVTGGALAASLPDLIWEDSLLRVLSSLLAIGDAPIVCSTATLLGGTSAPAICLAGGGLRQPAA